MGCHTRRTGFFGDPSISFHEKQSTIHLPQNQEEAIYGFLKHVEKNKHFDSPKEKTTTLDRLKTQLRNPRENLAAILPTGFLDILRRKQEEAVHPSSILEFYNKQK